MSTKSQIRLIRLAIQQARRSECRYKVGAVIAQGSRILSASANLQRNSSPSAFKFATYHAEEAALRQIRFVRNPTVYVARVGGSGNVLLAKPCARCQYALHQAGVAKALYTTDGGSIHSMRILGTLGNTRRGMAVREYNGM
ncbi:hypothetical protein ACN6AT_35575 (plasmid) [Streptomyces sp. JL4002]|uniref:hypothetical protein n=1 Tax=Streptomyces sp. JL4002 TaxID=3404781 RepID=UPI003B285EA2